MIRRAGWRRLDGRRVLRVPGIAGIARNLRDRADGRQRQADHDRGAPVGRPRCHPRRRAARAGRSSSRASRACLETGKPISRCEDGAAAGDDGGVKEAVQGNRGLSRPKSGEPLTGRALQARGTRGSRCSHGFLAGMMDCRVQARQWPPRTDIAQRSAALILSSAAAPGHSSASPSALSGVSTVLRWRCRSSGSGST